MPRDKMFFFACSHCHSKLLGNYSNIGQAQRCAQCHRYLVTPEPLPEIPPTVAITKVQYVPEHQRNVFVFSCNYCHCQQYSFGEKRGQRIFCRRCQIALKVPPREKTLLSLEVTPRKVVADHLKKVTICATLQDELSLPVVGEEVTLEISRCGRKPSHLSRVTNTKGQAVVLYQVAGVSETVEVTATIKQGKTATRSFTTYNGVDDGVFCVRDLWFFPRDPDEKCRGTLLLENPGIQEIILESMVVALEQNPEHCFRQQPNMRIPPRTTTPLSFALPPLAPQENSEATALWWAIELTGHNPTLHKPLHLQQNKHRPLVSKSSLQWRITTTHHNCERAGEAFFLEILALREGQLDESFCEEVEFFFTGENIPGNKFPKQQKLQFVQGRAQTGYDFTLWRAQLHVLTIECPAKNTQSKCQITVEPNELASITWQLPTLTHLVAWGEGAFLVFHDQYHNPLTNLQHPLIISSSRGELVGTANLAAPVALDVEGKLSLKDWTLCHLLPAAEYPWKVSLQAQCGEIEATTTCWVEPLPAQMSLPKIWPVSGVTEQSRSACIWLTVTNKGDTSWQLDSIGAQLAKTNAKQDREKFLRVVPLSNKLPLVTGHRQRTLCCRLFLSAYTPPGNQQLQFFVAGHDTYSGQSQGQVISCSIPWHVEPEGRFFVINTTNNRRETAGESFGLEIRAFLQQAPDPSYCGKKTLFLRYSGVMPEDDPHVFPDKLELMFAQGIAHTEKLFCMFRPFAGEIFLYDPQPGGGKGRLRPDNFQVVAPVGWVKVQKIAVGNLVVEEGQREQITVILENTGRTTLYLEKLTLVIVPPSHLCQEISPSWQTSSWSLAPEGQLRLTSEIVIPPLWGKGKIYAQLAFSDDFYQDTTVLCSHKSASWHILATGRKFALQPPSTIIAGEPFACHLTVLHQGEQDTSYHGEHRVYFSLHCETEQQPGRCWDFWLEFVQGTAVAPDQLVSFTTQRQTLTAHTEEVGSVAGQELLQTLPGKLHSFQLTLGSPQIANRPFTGPFEIRCFDAFGNRKVDFHGELAIRSMASGEILYQQQAIVFASNMFEQGCLSVAADKIIYRNPHQQQEEHIELLLKAEEVVQRQKLVMAPEPGKLRIETIKCPSPTVEWLEKKHALQLSLANIGGSQVELTNISLDFFHHQQPVNRGYQVLPEITFPFILKGGERSTITIHISLARVPIGSHQATIEVQGHDRYFQERVTTHQEISHLWYVEPRGREFVAKIVSHARAWESFAVTLEVYLEGKLDKLYSGKREVYTSIEQLDLPHLPPAQTSSPLLLSFHEGRAVTPEIFTLYQAKQAQNFHFWEKGRGAARGTTQLKVNPESWRHWQGRKRRDLVQLAKRYQQLLWAVLVGIVFLCLLTIHYQRVAATKKLEIVQIRGDIRVEEQQAIVGQIVTVDQQIEVPKGGFCVLKMTNGSLVKLQGNSQVYTKNLGRGFLSSTFFPAFNVTLGSFIYQAGEEENTSIELPHAEDLDIASKHFRLGVQTQQATLSIYHGKVTVTSGGKAVEVGEGKGSSLKKGNHPSEPVELPQPPKWLQPKKQEVVTTNKVPFRWRATKGISEYALEVYEQQNHPVPLHSEVTPENFVKVANLANGAFVAQVSCVDDNGFASLPSELRHFHHEAKFPARELLIQATGVAGQAVAIEEITVNGQPFTNGKELKVGSYQVKVEADGYFAQKFSVTLQEGEAPYQVDLALQPKPRSLDWQLTCQGFPDFAIQIEQVKWQHQEQGQIQQAQELPDQLLPGTYSFAISAHGCLKWEQTAKITAEETPQNLAATFIPKPRDLELQIVPSSYQGHEAMVTLHNQQGQAVSPVQLSPGHYQLQVELFAYQKHEQKFLLPPGKGSFPLTIALSAQARKISDVVEDPQRGEKDEIVSWQVNNQNQSLDFRFIPGKTYRLWVQLEQHEPLLFPALEIPPGEKPYRLQGDLLDLPSYMVKIPAQRLSYDQQNYSLEVWAQDQPLPKQLVSFHRLGSFHYCEFQVSKEVKWVTFFWGFYYQRGRVDQLQEVKPKSIDVARLLEHLHKIPLSEQLSRLEKIIFQEQENLPVKEAKQQLSDYLKKLQQHHPQEQKTLQSFLAEIHSW